jgi:hypothetical protein
MAEFELRRPGSGMLMGLCPSCGRMMHRAVKRTELEQHRAHLDVTIRRPVATIVGEEKHPLNLPVRPWESAYGNER